MPSKTSLFLIGSLAVNAALLGVVGGRMVGSAPKETPSAVQLQLERYGPTSDVVAAAWAKLPDADRKELRKQLRDRWVSLEGERNKLREAGQAVYEAAKSEPFDEARLRDAVTIFQQREYRMQQSAEDILIGHLGRMPSEARATAAVGLLTPFNARMQRTDRPPKREGAKGAGAAKDETRGDGQQGGLEPSPTQAGGDAARQPKPN